MKNEKLTYNKIKELVIKTHLVNMRFKRKDNDKEKEDLWIA